MAPITRIDTAQTAEEQKNIDVVKEYVTTVYSPANNKGRASIAHLVAENATFVAPTTLPECKTPLDYADTLATVLKSLSNTKMMYFNKIFAKDGHVLLHCQATGSHCGDPYEGIERTLRRARWTAAMIFEVEGGKIKSVTKEWNKDDMWKQLKWDAVEEEEAPGTP